MKKTIFKILPLFLFLNFSSCDENARFGFITDYWASISYVAPDPEDRLAFTSETLNLQVGDTFNLRDVVKLRHQTKRLGDIQWYTNDSNMAPIEGCILFAEEAGVTTVKANLGTLTDVITVAVEALPEETEVVEEEFAVEILDEEPDVEPEDNTITEELLSLTLKTDDEYAVGIIAVFQVDMEFASGTTENAVNWYVTPQKLTGQLEWDSSNPDVISVKNGVATMLSYGSSTISVTAFGETVSQDVHVKMASETPASYWDRYLGEDDDFDMTYGTNAGYGDYAFPWIFMSYPQGETHVVSFGGGGELVIELNGYLPVDATGPDFTIFENPIISDYYGHFVERAQVSVSQDGNTWHTFECDAWDDDEIYAGCAGTTPTDYDADFLNPEVSGGDTFDLADVGLSYARYLKITDLNTCTADDPTYTTSDGTTLCGENTKQGFDLDAIAILNGMQD